MDALNHTIISWTLLLPLLGALGIVLAPSERVVRWLAAIATAATFLVSLHLPFHFDAQQGGMQFIQNLPWIQSLDIHYFVAVDGISLWLVVLTTLLTFFGVLVSWKAIHYRVKFFYALLLILETGMLGVFVGLDLMLFYTFWEVALVPMALLIGIWGHERRIYAAVKFFLYTLAGSVLMLASIIWLHTLTGSFNYLEIQRQLATGVVRLSPHAEMVLFLGFFLAFAIKVPLFPFHTWLPDAHVEAPTAGSVLLAGVLLKMGPYGMLRFNLGLFPHASERAAKVVIILALIGIIYGALVAFVQPNMKKLVAYSSVSHMGFIVLGIFSFTLLGTQGALNQMLNHGISTGGLFILVGMLYERRHTFELAEYGGLATQMPIYAAFFVVIVMSSAGLPMLNGFVGEFLIMLGAYTARHAFGAIAATGVILSAMYLLRMTKATLWGENSNPANATLADADTRERFVLAGIVLLALYMGVQSTVFTHPTEAAATQALAPFNGEENVRLRAPLADPRVSTPRFGDPAGIAARFPAHPAASAATFPSPHPDRTLAVVPRAVPVAAGGSR